LSVAAQWSIIGSFAELATTVSHLRAFVRVTYASLSLPHVQKPTSAPTTVLRSAAQRRASRTQEAFAEAVDAEIRALERWCADREEAILRAQSGLGQPLVISLLSLERDISTTFGGAFIALLDVLRAVVRAAGGMSDAVTATPVDALSALRTPPARLSALFLNTLLGAAQDCSLLGDSNAANVLFRVFVHAVEPLWEMAHAWLRDGMHVRTFVDPTAIDLRAGEVGLDDEFFIEDNELSVLDPDFWADGYILRSDDTEPEDLGGGRSGIPSFLVNIVELVLGAGKAVGLLRALGMPTTNDVEKQGINYQDWISKWRPFEDTLAAARLYTSPGASTQGNLAVSTAVLSSAIYDEIAPACSSVQATLAHVVIQDCELWYHLYAMEDLYLMRRGDVMSEFADVLFARVRVLPFGTL
jgi:gamma-tubulin complex component 5